MKKLINLPDNVVSDMLEGVARVRPDLIYIPKFEVITRKDKINKVGIVSGGGSGHEPAHAGYVGRGMLDAAVAGNVFASPSPDRVLCGIKESDQGKGVLLVIKNYSGDVMNFEMACELAEMEGIKVKKVIVKDDVSVDEKGDTSVTGRRGIAGTVFVHKIAGAKAELGAELSEVARVAQKAIDNVRSMGMALSACTLPAVGKPGFELGENEIEIGMGIHGEPGIQRTTIKSARELARILCDRILNDLDYEGRQVAVLINGMGGTPLMELYIMAKEVDEYLKEKGIEPIRYLVGNYMTSLEMAGCSVSLLRLDDELLFLLDQPCDTLVLRMGNE